MDELVSLSSNENIVVYVVIKKCIRWTTGRATNTVVHVCADGLEKEGKEKCVRETTTGRQWCCILQTSTELQSTGLLSHTKKTQRHCTFTHACTHLCLQGTSKLEVEGCHLWLNRQKYNPTHTPHHNRFKSIHYKCDCTNCFAVANWYV